MSSRRHCSRAAHRGPVRRRVAVGPSGGPALNDVIGRVRAVDDDRRDGGASGRAYAGRRPGRRRDVEARPRSAAAPAPGHRRRHRRADPHHLAGLAGDRVGRARRVGAAYVRAVHRAGQLRRGARRPGPAVRRGARPRARVLRVARLAGARPGRGRIGRRAGVRRGRMGADDRLSRRGGRAGCRSRPCVRRRSRRAHRRRRPTTTGWPTTDGSTTRSPRARCWRARTPSASSRSARLPSRSDASSSPASGPASPASRSRPSTGARGWPAGSSRPPWPGRSSDGADKAYLQTMHSNHAAIALYKPYGFVDHHDYRYLEPGDTDSSQ